VYRRAAAEWERTRELVEAQCTQRLLFSHGPVAMAWMADLHLGGSGVDYPRLFAEARAIVETPGMFIGTVGDVVDSWIVGRLQRMRFGTRLSIPDEWALVRKFLRLIAPKLRVAVSGNHDDWTILLAGVDYFADVLRQVDANCIYGQSEARLTVQVGAAEWPGRIRHKWRGSSIYNPTHGIERAAKWDQDFAWAVGAHTHQGGVVRSFNHAGVSGMAAMCGSYKRVDGYAIAEGFPRPNVSTAVVLVFDDETDSITGFDNLEMAMAFMSTMYQEEEA
jgi:hypothetical protein